MRVRPTILLAAADPSGDALAAEVAGELLRREPGLRLIGAAGPRMREAGVEPVVRPEGLGTVGPVESLAVVGRALRALRALEAELPGCEACLTVDAPSLWLRLARRARAREIPALHVVAPQVWAWRPGRIPRIAASVDSILCLLPFEPAWFEGQVRAVFVGHPAAALRPAPSAAEGRPVFALCPGSRPAEVARLWPVFREVARRLRRRWPRASFLVPRAPGIPKEALGGLDASEVPGIAACAGADAALVASGTATLELAALDVPMVVAYRLHPLSAAIARRLLRLPHVALPNLLAREALVPEHLQDLDPEALASDLAALAGRRGQVPRELIASLRGEGAAARIADEVDLWRGRRPPSAPGGLTPGAPPGSGAPAPGAPNAAPGGRSAPPAAR